MKPKARYDAQRGLWLVHGGNLRNGCATYPNLREALAAWQRCAQLMKNTFAVTVPPIAMTINEWAGRVPPLPPGKIYKTVPSPVQIIQQLEKVIEMQWLEIDHCHAVCDELRQQLTLVRRSELMLSRGPHWSGKQS